MRCEVEFKVRVQRLLCAWFCSKPIGMAEVSNFEHFMAHREEDVSEILQLQNFPQTVVHSVHCHEFFFPFP